MARNDIDLGMSIKEAIGNINQTASTTNSNNSTLRRIMLGKVAIPELTIGETTEEDSTAKTKIKYKKNSDGTESIAIEGNSFDIENQIKIGNHGRITNYSGDSIYTEIKDDSELWLISENEDGQLSYIDIFPEKIDYYSPNHSFKGNVDFTEATVTGLNLGGGTLAIEVEELPTENIDDSKIYVLSVIENKEVYYHFEGGYFTLKDLVATTQGIQADITYYVVKELPTSPLTTNLATFSIVHCYIYNDIAYVYGNAGAGNMWLTVSTLVSQISGITVIDKGRTPNIATENNDIAMYVYYEDYKKFYLYSNEQWVQITDSKSNTYILSLSGTSGTLTDEQYQAIKDNFPNVIVLYTERESNATGTLVMPITGTVNGLYIATYTANTAVSNITIYANKSWDFQEYNFKNVYVTMDSAQSIGGDKTFNGKATFNGAVDFTNATVTGLPEPDLSNLVTLDTEQTISGKKTFNGIKIGNANIEWNESGFKELDIKIDEGNGALVFRADDVSLLSNNDIMIERGGLSAVNVSSSGIYIYDENVDTGNCANINFEDGIISLSSDNKIDFSGKVDFSNATVTGLPTSGGSGSIDTSNLVTLDTEQTISGKKTFSGIEIGNATIGSTGSLTNEGGYTTLKDDINLYLYAGEANNYIDIYADYIEYFGNHQFNGLTTFSGTVDFTNATVTGLPSGGSLDLNADYNWNGNHTFNNGLTLNGALTLANNGIIEDSEEQLQIYKGTGSMWIGTEEGGEILITNDNTKIESYNGLDLLGTQIALHASGNESSSSINIYDTSIEYHAQVHQFFGEVDFSDATVTGLSVSGSSDLTELKRVMRLLHAEKYTQSIQATKFTSTPMGSIHKIEKPSNGLLEASEYVLYSVDFEDAPAYPNATITIGNNGLINDSGTFSFTLQGRSIATGQNINVICVFVPSAFL